MTKSRVWSHQPPAAHKLGQFVRHFRSVNHLGRVACSQLLGISRPMLNLIEANRANPTLSTLDRIARAMDSEAWELIY